MCVCVLVCVCVCASGFPVYIGVGVGACLSEKKAAEINIDNERGMERDKRLVLK